jgi:hypothetical protein
MLWCVVLLLLLLLLLAQIRSAGQMMFFNDDFVLVRRPSYRRVQGSSAPSLHEWGVHCH